MLQTLFENVTSVLGPDGIQTDNNVKVELDYTPIAVLLAFGFALGLAYKFISSKIK